MIQIYPDAPSLALAAAETIADIVESVLRVRAKCTLVLAGGGTPRPVYRALVRHHRDSVSWDRVRFLVGDERMVPPDHPESNYGMDRRELLSPLGVPDDLVVPVPTDSGSAPTAAHAYEGRLRRLFNTGDGSPPPFDLILLGLGEDGHTASLFPGCKALEETRRWVGWCRPDARKSARVTLTLPVVNAARMVMFLVSGRHKAPILRRVLDADEGPSLLPAQRVRPEHGQLHWMVDEAAAHRLPPGVGSAVEPPGGAGAPRNPRRDDFRWNDKDLS